MNLFYFYLNSASRRRAASEPRAYSGANYMLYGADLLPPQDFTVHHNLESVQPPSRPILWEASLFNRLLQLIKGSGGDFITVLQERRRANHADLIIATVDNVGMPLAYLKALGLVRPPLLYISIGLPERLQAIKPAFTRNLTHRLIRNTTRFVTYGWEEARWLRQWLGLPPDSNRVVFIPFGVDTVAFAPERETQAEVDVLSVGADMQRDFGLLLEAARALPAVSFRLITTPRHAESLSTVPPNLEILTHVPFPEIGHHLAAARLVAIPCHPNTYSAGTTTLLQAMAKAKPVIVSRTGAIQQGYYLEDHVNCRLVEPGSSGALNAAIRDLLSDPAKGRQLGDAARKTIEMHLTWPHYVQRLITVIKECRP